MKNKKKANDNRTRQFAFMIYEDSANENWRELLKDSHVQGFISPIHDKDTNPDGQIKKPHYHVIVMYDGKKSLEQFQRLMTSVGCANGHLEEIQSPRGYSRYLCHMDHPEKHQYNPSDVICLGGTDYFAYCQTTTDKYKIISQMIAFCVINNICSYAQLLIYAKDHRQDWFRILCDNGTYVMRELVKSMAWTLEKGMILEVDDSPNLIEIDIDGNPIID